MVARAGLILWALGRYPLRSRFRRGPQRLQRAALRVIGRDDPCDLVERQILKPSRLRHATADQPIYDGTETATASPGSRRFYHLGKAITPTIVPVMERIAIAVSTIEVPPSPSFGARRDQANAQGKHEQYMRKPGSGHGGVLFMTKRRNAPGPDQVPERKGPLPPASDDGTAPQSFLFAPADEQKGGQPMSRHGPQRRHRHVCFCA
jgi:hypothetical protein